MNNLLKKTVVAGGIVLATATGAFAQRAGGDGDQPAPHCCDTNPGTPGTPINNNNNISQNVTQQVKNHFLSLGLGAAAAAVDGCTAIEGVGVGGGYAGIGAILNFSKVNKSYFLICKNYQQLEAILKTGNCPAQRISITAMANGAPEDGLPGNPMLRNALQTQQGLHDYRNMCRGKGFSLKWGG